MVTGADLVLTMTRAHRQNVLHRAPRALARTFTLREAADLVGRLGDASFPGEDLAERARSLVKGMNAARSERRSGAEDDVRDPIGQSLEVHDEVGTVIVASLLPVLKRIADLRTE
jgi:protein-tyrosine-phosphatase